MRRVFVIVVLAIAVIVFALLAVPCLAQDPSTGPIHGTVFDPSIRRIAGANVALVNSATGFRYEQTTNSQGQFGFELLPPGDYTARVTSEGMSPQFSSTLHVEIGGVTDIAFKMTLAGTHESVTVSAEPKVVETEPRGLSSVIDERAILNLPLNGCRFTDLPFSLPESLKTHAAQIPPLTASRNSFVGPNYSTTDMRLSRKLYVHKGVRLEFTAESFNLLNRLNLYYQITDDGLMNNQAQFNYGTKKLGINHFPAYYQVPTNFMKATGACAPCQIQFALRLGF